MSGTSAHDLRRQVIHTRERLAAADRMATRATNLRHDLSGVVEAQRRSAPHAWDEQATANAFEMLVDPPLEERRFSERVEQIQREYRGTDETAALQDALERFLVEGFEFLRGAYVDDDGTRRTAFEAFRTTTTVEDDDLRTFVDRLESYVTGAAFMADDGSIDHADRLRAPFLRAMNATAPTPGRLLAFVERAVEAARTYRGDLRDQLNTTVDDSGTEHAGLVQRFLDAAADEQTDPAAFLDAHPVALLPVRVETRYVDDSVPLLNESPDREPHLRIRVFPDDIHVDTHEQELTRDEERLGRFFWAKLWICAHPDPAAAMGRRPGTSTRTNEVERNETRNHLETTLDPHEFDTFPALYESVKRRSWGQLVDRLGRERAAWVVHRMAPLNGSDELLEGWTRAETLADGGEDDELSPDSTVTGDDSLADRLSSLTAERQGDWFVDLGTQGPYGSVDLRDRLTLDPSLGTSDGDADPVFVPPFEPGPSDDPNANVPTLSFPTVENRPDSWTKQPRAELLPDQWVVYGWSERSAADDDGERDARIPDWARERLAGSAAVEFDANIEEYLRDDFQADLPPERFRPDGGSGTAPDLVVRGPAIREPLPMGPDPKAEDDHTESPTETSDAAAPEGLKWTVDFEVAERAGMGLRVSADDLDQTLGPDEDITDVAFDRLVVLGVKSTMSAEQSTTGLRALFEAHHYTDGLEFLEGGTATNNTDEDSDYTARDDPAESVAVECGPPLTGFGDDARPGLGTTVPTDGDILGRVLGVADPDASPHNHVFAHVENANRVDTTAQHHANAALWDGTLGYYLRNVVLSNRWTDHESIWADADGTGPYTDLSEAASFFSNPADSLGDSMVWEDRLRRHFVRYVRADGPLPTVRAGAQPYGILPVTDVDRLESDPVVDLVTTLRGPFERAADRLTSVSDAELGDEDVRRTIRRILQRTANGDAYLPEALGTTDAGEVSWRRDLAAVLESTGLTDLDSGEPSVDPRLGWIQPRSVGADSTEASRAGVAAAASRGQLVGHTDDRFLSLLAAVDFEDLRTMGLDPNFDALAVDPELLPTDLTPENSSFGFSDEELLFYALTRADAEQWQDAAMGGGIDWGGSSIWPRDAIREGVAPPYVHRYYQLFDVYDAYGDPGTLHTLLRALSRFSLLQTYVSDRIRMPIEYGDLPALDTSTAAGGPVPDPGTSSGASVWDWVQAQRPNVDESWLSEIEHSEEYRIHDVEESLSVLSTLEPSSLQRLLTGTLSLASHRFDAWWTSLATRRLVENRRRGTDLRTGSVSEFTFESGTYSDGRTYETYTQSTDGGDGQAATSRYAEQTVTFVGAYGLVENLSADTAGSGSDEVTEFTQAPSVQHATTAALLRGAHKHLGETGDLAVDLSAPRVRKGRWVLQGLKHGQRLGALLGYRFERYVKEHGSGTEIGHLAEYRTAFPAIAGTLDHDGDGTTSTADAEFDVTDGYRLYHAWRRAESEAAFYRDNGESGRLPETPTIEDAIREVETTVAAIRDLLLAEDVHQLGMGNFDRAGWSLDGLASGEGVPDLDVLRTPRDGVDVSHRVATLFGEPDAATAPTDWQVGGSTVEPESLPAQPTSEDSQVAADAVTAVANLPTDGGPDPAGDDAHPRRAAERNLDAWAGEFLPDPTTVGAKAAFQWTDDRSFAAGSFSTPTEETTVSVRDVGFDPDVVLFWASTAVEKVGSTATGNGSVGWSHGVAARTGTDRIDEAATGVAAAPDGATASATPTDRAVSVVQLDETGGTERIIGTVRRTTSDGFDVAFTTVESGTPVVVEYLALSTGATGSVDVGHFQTPGGTGTHSEQLAVDADHVMLAVGAAGAPGYSHGHATATGDDIEEASVGVAAAPGQPGTVSARADRAVHLPYGGGAATSASVTSLGSTLDVAFSASADESFRDDGGTCVYVAFETPDDVTPPAVGILTEGHNDVGFEPGAISLVGAPGIARGDLPTSAGDLTGGVSASPTGTVSLSHGLSLGRGNQRSMTHAVRSDAPGYAAFAGTTAALTLLSTAADGAVASRTTCKLTGTDDRGFTASFPEGGASDCLALYVAWPADPETLAHEESTSVYVDDLDLAPIDLLYHSQQDSDAGESQLEQRMAYELFRTRRSLDPTFPIPDTATVNLQFTEAPDDAAFSIAELLEVLRSVRALALESRSVDADDLVHPAEAQGTGYTEPAEGVTTSTVGDLRNRALGGVKALQSVRETVENRRAALSATDDGDATLTQRMSALRRAVETYDAAVPTAAIDRTLASLDADDISAAVSDPAVSTLGEHLPSGRTIDSAAVDDVGDLLLWELETLGRFLPAGPTEEPDGENATTMAALTDRTLAGVADVPGRAEVDLHVWQGSPGSSFALETETVTTDTTGAFETTVDCSDATPGELVTVVGTFRRDLPEPTDTNGSVGEDGDRSEGDADSADDPSDDRGIVRLSTLLPDAEYRSYDWAERVDAVRRIDATATDAAAVLDTQKLQDGAVVLGLRVVVSDPRATLVSEGESVVVTAGESSERVKTGFRIAEVEARDSDAASEWLVRSADAFTDERTTVDPGDLQVDASLFGDTGRDGTDDGDSPVGAETEEHTTELRIDSDRLIRAVSDRLTVFDSGRFAGTSDRQIPQQGDVVYAATARVTPPDAGIVVEMDSDTSGPVTTTVEWNADLDQGTTVTIAATLSDGSVVDSTTATVDENGALSASLTLGGLAPRTAFTVTGTAHSELLFERSGCVLTPDDRHTPADVLSRLTVLPRLLWLDGETAQIDPTMPGTPGARLRDALTSVDWERVDDELDAMRAYRSRIEAAGEDDHALTDRVIGALETVTSPDEGDSKAIESFDPIVLHTNVDRLVEPLSAIGVTDAFSTVGTPVDRTSLRYWSTPGADLGRVQGALKHAVENPAVLLGERTGIDESFAPGFKGYVEDQSSFTEDMAQAFSHYLGELFDYTGEFVQALDEHVDSPHEFLRHFGALVYEPDRFASDADPTTFQSQFSSFANAVQDVAGIEDLLTPSPVRPTIWSEDGQPTVTATLDGSTVALPGTVVADTDEEEFELVLENTSGNARSVELHVETSDHLVITDAAVATLEAAETRRIELALVRPTDAPVTATVTVTDRDANVSASIDVTIPPKAPNATVTTRNPVFEFWFLCQLFDRGELSGYVSSVMAGTHGGLPAPASATADYAQGFDRWVGVAAAAADGARSRVDSAVDAGTPTESPPDESAAASDRVAEPLPPGAFDDALRIGMLEPLRRALLRTSYLGVYGATPQSPAGGSPDDVEDLVAQAAAVVEQLDDRLRAVDVALSGVTQHSSTDEVVDAAMTAVEAMFDDAFTVYPVFEPHNSAELSKTFTDDALLPADEPLAAETFLGRLAQVRDRPRAFREAYSYGEVVTGRPMLDLTVGQLPHRPGEEWIGLSGTAVSTNRQSLVTQLETGVASGGVAAGPIAGVFVDDWNETVPEKTQTAGVAVNYDGPDSTAGNAILLATPPTDRGWSWSAGDVRDMVVDAIETMRIRLVDPAGAREQLGELLPAIWLPDVSEPEPAAPSVDLSLLEHDAWETYRQDVNVLAVIDMVQQGVLLAFSELSYETFVTGSYSLPTLYRSDTDGGSNQ